MSNPTNEALKAAGEVKEVGLLEAAKHSAEELKSLTDCSSWNVAVRIAAIESLQMAIVAYISFLLMTVAIMLIGAVCGLVHWILFLTRKGPYCER